MRLIDADALMEIIKEPCKDCTQMDCGCFLCDQCEITEEAERVEEAPTVDAVEVVRCSACKYYQKVYGGVPLGEVGHCICHSFETVPDWYCADGERREEDERRANSNH